MFASLSKRALGHKLHARSFSRSAALAEVALVTATVAVTYFFDSESGRRRRSMVRDKLTRGLRQTTRAAEKKSRHLRNRAYGLFAQTRSYLDDASDAGEADTPRA